MHVCIDVQNGLVRNIGEPNIKSSGGESFNIHW